MNVLFGKVEVVLPELDFLLELNKNLVSFLDIDHVEVFVKETFD